jgi:Acyl-CoA carboxylase epsilon subunit
VGAHAGRFELRSISPDATPEEVAAITAAISASIAAARAEAAGDESEGRSTWVQAARISGRRGGYSRGEWRLSGRLGRRHRA